MLENGVYRVIKIIDAYHLVINAGSSHGFSEGDEIEVFVKGEELTDPFNDDKPIGRLDYIKTVLTIEDVYPMFSVCVCEVREKIESISPFSSAVSHFARPKQEYRYSNARLNVKDEDITGGFPETDKEIMIGDEVRSRNV